MGFRSDPESEFFVNLIVARFEDGNQLFHELKSQVAVLEHSPASVLEAFLHDSHGLDVLSFSHGDGLERELLLFLGKLFDGTGWVTSGRKEEEDRFLEGRSFPDLVDGVGNGTCEFLSENLKDEV